MPQPTSTLQAELAALPHCDVVALRQRWTELYKRPAPDLQRDMLMRAIAYRLQERAYGGLAPATSRKLRKIADELHTNRHAPLPDAPKIMPGTQLLREWNGATEVVDVGPRGFIWRGQAFKSLSAVARAITGARWSGPRFFGLPAGKPNQHDALGEIVTS